MNRSVIDLWVSIFVAIGIGAILFLALKVGNLVSFGNTPGYRLEARFDNIGGLKLRAPVKAAGVMVGRVESVRLDTTTYQAIVTMKIDQGYDFTTDTIAAILTSGLLGEVYVGLGPPDQELETPPGSEQRIVQWVYNEYRSVITFTGQLGFSRLRLTPSSRSEFARLKALAKMKPIS